MMGTIRVFGFDDALSLLKQGQKVARIGWNGKGMWLILVRGSDPRTTTGDYSVNPLVWDGECLPFIAIKTTDDKFVPWVASQTDLLASDWIEIG